MKDHDTLKPIVDIEPKVTRKLKVEFREMVEESHRIVVPPWYRMLWHGGLRGLWAWVYYRWAVWRNRGKKHGRVFPFLGFKFQNETVRYFKSPSVKKPFIEGVPNGGTIDVEEMNRKLRGEDG